MDVLKKLGHLPLVCFCLIFLAFDVQWVKGEAAATSESQESLGLTPAEQQWLKEHPTINIAVMDKWVPLNFVNYPIVIVNDPMITFNPDVYLTVFFPIKYFDKFVQFRFGG